MTHAELEAALGVKIAAVVAGFFGAVISLAFDRKLSIFGAMLAVLAGVSCAAFVTPVVAYYWEMPKQLENGIAFFLGLGGLILMGKAYRAFQSLDFPAALRGKIDNKEEK
jgi:drug/metabolite transporter (DMT)-like permease